MALPEYIDIERSGDLIDIELTDHPNGEGGFISICMDKEEAHSLATILMQIVEDMDREEQQETSGGEE